MSVAEMQQFVAKNVQRVDDAGRLEKMVHLIEDAKPELSMKAFFEDAVARYGDVLQKLAE